MFFSESKILINKEQNKKGEFLEVYISPKENLWNGSPNYLTLITSKKERMTLNFYVDGEKSIHLSDILVPKGSNEGYGSILLKTLLKNAEELNFLKVHGQLFYDDEEHRKIQINFYKKFGFEIFEGDIIVRYLKK